LFVLIIPSPSRNMGDSPGTWIDGAASASDMSSMVLFLGGPLFASSLAPLSEVNGEYSTQICPLESPVTIYLDLSNIPRVNHEIALPD
jgi:hypothetical protein